MDRRYARSWVAIVLFLIVFLVVSVVRRCDRNIYQYDEGLIFGTFYHITYRSDESLAEAIKQQLLRFDGSLSPFNDTSLITRSTRGCRSRPMRGSSRSLPPRSRSIAARAEPLIPRYRRWSMPGDSGSSRGYSPTRRRSTVLLAHVGMNKLSLENHRVVKSDSLVTLTSRPSPKDMPAM